MTGKRPVAVAAAVLLLLAGGVAAPGQATDPEPVEIGEASGVTFRDGFLYVVDDSVRNACFRMRLPDNSEGMIDLNELRPERVAMSLGILTDLDSIEFLADGRLVVLSERLRALADADGPVVEYDYPLAEVGRRGLEGLAVRALPDGSSRVAVLWEGGYPDYGSLHPQVQEALGHIALSPLVFVHDIAPGARPGRIRWRDGLSAVELVVPKPAGMEPDAQRFRAPAIAWCRLPERGADEWGFLVMLSSQNAVAEPEFLNHWLQRFDSDGQPAGDPLDLADVLPPESAHLNWEGLAWFERGRKVVLVHEGQGPNAPHALILELPSDWQFGAE